MWIYISDTFVWKHDIITSKTGLYFISKGNKTVAVGKKSKTFIMNTISLLCLRFGKILALNIIYKETMYHRIFQKQHWDQSH